MSGYGEYYWNDGKIYKGNWENNKMNGEGEFFWPSKKSFKGTYKDDKKHGAGVFKWPDGKELHMNWVDGQPSGEAKLIDEAGNIMELEGSEIQRFDVAQDVASSQAISVK